MKQIAKKLFQTGTTLTARLRHGTVDASPEGLRLARNFFFPQYATPLGTAIHASPVFAALKAAVPDARIIVGVHGFCAEILAENPAIERMISTPSPLQDVKGAIAALRAANMFEGQPYVTVCTGGNERTKVAIMALQLGKTALVGFTEAPAMFQVPLRFDKQMSQIDNNLRLVRVLGHSVRGQFEPEIFPAKDDINVAESLLHEAGFLDGRPIAAFVTQTSVTQKKGWRPERFRAVAEHLVKCYGAHILFVGTKGEAESIDRLRAELNVPNASIAGKTGIRSLAAVLQRCQIGITLDTGPLHVGRAARLPMVVIAPAWSPVLEWLPVDRPSYRILKNLDMATAPEQYIIDEVSVDEVIAAADELMRSGESS